MNNEDMSLVKSFKIELPLWILIQLFIVTGVVIYLKIIHLVSVKVPLLPATINDKVFSFFVFSLWLYELLLCIAAIVLVLRGKNCICIYENRLTWPSYVLGYFTIKEILFSDIRGIFAECVPALLFWPRRYYWCLNLYTRNGKKYIIYYGNKNLACLNEICELVKVRLPPEKQLSSQKKPNNENFHF